MFVENLNNGWKMFSNQIFALIGAASVLEQNWGAVSYFIPPQHQAVALAVTSLVGVIGRLVKQPSVHTN